MNSSKINDPRCWKKWGKSGAIGTFPPRTYGAVITGTALSGEPVYEVSDETVTCRECHTTYVPSFINDFYADDAADPKVGLCERCMMNEKFGMNTKAPHPLPEGYEKRVCKPGQGAATCAFLTMGPEGIRCGKDSAFEKAIRERVAEGTMRSKGDNCSGSPDFTLTQVQ